MHDQGFASPKSVSIQARIHSTTVLCREQCVDTSKMKLLGMKYWGILIPNIIQPKDRQMSSMGGGIDGISYNCYVIFNRWNDERNVNVDRDDSYWNSNYWFPCRRNSLHF
jgi:hypothetical protein